MSKEIDRINELENRHQSLKKDCDFEEKDMRRKISIKEDRIRNSRTFEAENKYAVVTNPELVSSKQNEIISTLLS